MHIHIYITKYMKKKKVEKKGRLRDKTVNTPYHNMKPHKNRYKYTTCTNLRSLKVHSTGHWMLLHLAKKKAKGPR